MLLGVLLYSRVLRQDVSTDLAATYNDHEHLAEATPPRSHPLRERSSCC